MRARNTYSSFGGEGASRKRRLPGGGVSKDERRKTKKSDQDGKEREKMLQVEGTANKKL